MTTDITVNITGTASDAGGGTVQSVQVSVDGGATWNLATGTTEWSYAWSPALPGAATIKSRAIDNSGNVQDPPAQAIVTVQDRTRPTSTITTPTKGAVISVGTTVTITGTANDAGGGTVSRVDVSVDSGGAYSAATGTTSWSYMWTPTTPGRVTIKSRAVDDSGNLQDPPDEITVTVPIRVPSDQPTIQSAIDVATAGGLVLVAPGTYTENINFKGKAITVTSESGPQVTFIDGGDADSVVIFTSGEGRDSVLNGFTLQNGRRVQGSAEGGGITILAGSSPTITNNEIRNNRACSGGGIGIGSGSPLIQLNTITGNGSDSCTGGGGAGISIGGASSAEILDNVISDNASSFISFGGGIQINGSSPIIKRNIIRGNNVAGGEGGGIYMASFSEALIVQNLITGNQASEGGGVYWLVPSGARGPILVNNTIVDNNATSFGSGIFAEGSDGRTELTNNIIVAKPGQFGLYCGDLNNQDQPIIRFNNIFSAGGMAYGGICSNKTGMDGNISVDPMFTNPAQGDYHLQQGSPSIDAGDNLNPNLPDTDIDGDPRVLDGDGNESAIVDMGVDEFRRTIRVPSEQPTIQSAINVARNGAIVLVAPGTYVENINFGGKAITVTSESGPQDTIIDGGNADSVVRISSGEGRNSILNGFTLQNGRAHPIQGVGRGGGMIIGEESSPTITNNVIRNNHACGGGGIAIFSGSPLIRLNTISGNSNNLCDGGTVGGGIHIVGPGSAEILDNVISDNMSRFGGGIGLFTAGTPILKRNIIKGNNASEGGGLWIVNDSDPLIVQNIITGNQATDGGGVYWLGSRGPIFVNNTIADNNATSNGSGIFAEGSSGRTQLVNNIIVAKPGQAAFYCGNLSGQNQAIIRFNNIFSAGGAAYGGTCADKTGTDGNISADPLFTDPAQGDYHLQQGSPSIDSGDNLAPNLPDTDIDGDPRILDGDGDGTAIIDMGIDEFLPLSGIKVSFQDDSNGNMLKINWPVSVYSMRGNHRWRRRKSDIERQFDYFSRLRR